MDQSVVPCVNIKCSTGHKNRHYFTFIHFEPKNNVQQSPTKNVIIDDNFTTIQFQREVDKKCLKCERSTTFYMQCTYCTTFSIPLGASCSRCVERTIIITIFLSCIVVKLYYQTAESHKPLRISNISPSKNKPFKKGL